CPRCLLFPYTTLFRSPKPPCERSKERSICVNSSKILGSISGEMPIPESRMLRTICSTSRATLSSICPPDSVYLAALLRRLATARSEEHTSELQSRGHL